MPMTLPISSQVYLPAAARSVFVSSSAPLAVLLFPHQHFVEHLSAPSGAAEQPWSEREATKETVQEIKRLGVGSFQSFAKNTLPGTVVPADRP